MTPRRPPRAWIGSPRPVDAQELLGPRGLTEDVLRDDEAAANAELDHDARFWWAQLTPRRRARIESVVSARLRVASANSLRFGVSRLAPR